ncbi:MAG: glycosyltransferase family 2 protein [Planctomycetes bacterium]|nr:glycosyltransferase family 2 protein [Planctomycetota bacterium]
MAGVSEETVRISPPAIAEDRNLERVERSLDELEQLTEQATRDEQCAPPRPDYPLPAGFLLSVVIPVFNEEATIEHVIARLQALPLPLELVIVDDHSTDGTRGILRRYEDEADMRIIYKPQNEGKGAALRTGFAKARGDVIVVQDADLEYDPRDLVRLIRPIVEGRAEVAYGSRYRDDRNEDAEFRRRRQRDSSLLHRLGNAALTCASNCFTGLRLTDMETCYKAFRRDAIQRIELQQDRFGIEPEITAKIARRGHRVCEVPISYQPRSYAEGKKIRLRDAWQALACIVRYGVWERS